MVAEVARRFPGLADRERLVREGRVLVNGFPVTNPRSLVSRADAISLREDAPLRGEAKLRGALDAFGVEVAGRVAVDVGAAAGGFTKVLLERGAARVYAVDAGRGQLLGSLRQDARVVNLEATNLGDLTRGLVPDRVEIVTMDLSYLALATAIPQLEALDLIAGADLVALVKPQFELGLAELPRRPEAAVRRAAAGAEAAGWRVLGSVESPVKGARGAIEFLLHARRPQSER